MKKTLIILFTLIISLNIVVSHELSEYPDFFIEDDDVNLILVVGDKAPASHVIAQVNLGLSLGNVFGEPLINSNKLASEVYDIDDTNIISIGNACINNITSKILSNPEPCNRDFEKGTASIKLIESKNDKVHIVLSSDSDEGIKKVANILSNYLNFTFTNNVYEIELGDVDNDEVERSTTEIEQEDKEMLEKKDEPQVIQEPIKEDKNEPTEKNSKLENKMIEDSEGPESISQDKENLIKIIINWLKSLFTINK